MIVLAEISAVLSLGVLAVILVWLNFNKSKCQSSETITLVIQPSAFETPGSVDPAQLYAVINQLLASSNHLLNRPHIVFEVIFSADYGTSFLVHVPSSLTWVVKSQLLEMSTKLSVSEADQIINIPSQSGLISKTAVWHPTDVFPKAINLEQSVVSLLATNLDNLKDADFVSWQVSLTSARSRPLIRIISSLLKLCFGAIRTIYFLLIELIETDQRLAKQRSLNRRLKVSKHQSTNDQAEVLRVGMQSLITAKTNNRVEALNMSVSSALRTVGLDNSWKFNQTDKLMLTSLPYLYNLPMPGGRWEKDSRLTHSTQLLRGKGHQSKTDLVLGISGENVVGLSFKERQLHSLIIGGTGMGKSTLLGYSFMQDMANGNGAALIDPHGDLAIQMLKFVPPNRVDDVIYIDPGQLHYPVAINLMELPKDIVSEDELAIAKDFIAESIISIFRKLFSDDDSGGHRIEYVLRNAIYTAFSVPGATLLTLHKLLTDDLYRARVVSQIDDESLKDFWYGEYSKAGNYQRVKMISGVTAKLGRFERSQAINRMISKSKSTVDFQKLIDERKILICNFSKGTIGEDSASLLGMLVMAKLQLAAISRIRQQNTKRTPFYLYVDEFELFNANIFSQLISESRKFGMYLTLAEQTTAYQDERDCNILLANVGNIICFRTAAEVDNRRLIPLFSPYLSGTDLSNLNPYNFYLKTMGEQANRPVSASTVLLKAKGNVELAQRVVSHSHSLYSYPFIVKPDSSVKFARVPMSKS